MNNTPRGFIKCGWAFGCYAFRVLDGSTQQSPKSVEIVFPHWLRKCYACLTHSSVTSFVGDILHDRRIRRPPLASAHQEHVQPHVLRLLHHPDPQHRRRHPRRRKRHPVRLQRRRKIRCARPVRGRGVDDDRDGVRRTSQVPSQHPGHALGHAALVHDVRAEDDVERREPTRRFNLVTRCFHLIVRPAAVRPISAALLVRPPEPAESFQRPSQRTRRSVP